MKIWLDIPQSKVDSVISSGLGAIKYWCKSYRWDSVREEHCFFEEESNNEIRLTDSDFGDALAKMAVDCPQHFGNFMSKLGWDQTTGDVLIQLACFGELKYG